MQSLILFYFISFIFQFQIWELLYNCENTVFSTEKIPLSSSLFFYAKNEEGLLNTMYDIMTEEESFLKCLCKSIIEFFICNFSWKWPCSNKGSQITENWTSASGVYSHITPASCPNCTGIIKLIIWSERLLKFTCYFYMCSTNVVMTLQSLHINN